MGKQSRRKKGNRRSANNDKSINAATTEATNNTTVTQALTTPAEPSKSNLVNRIRHGDLRLRHGALTAASATIFSPESLANKAPINMELIQAMSERIMDDDAPCAMCALGCLGNYILFHDYSDTLPSANKSNKVETLLTPILLAKLDKACQHVQLLSTQMLEFQVELQQAAVTDELILINAQETDAAIAGAGGSTSIDARDSTNTNTNTNNSNNNHNRNNQKSKKKKTNGKSIDKYALAIMEEYSIQSLCLHALCGVVESTATNNESSSILYHQRDQFLAITMRSFLLAAETITALLTADSLATQTIATKENQSNVISDVLIYAARTIHSSCDDNPTLVTSLLKSQTFTNIVSSIANTALPPKARLHCCGIMIITHQVVPSKEMEQIVLNSLPLLCKCTVHNNDIASALHRQVKDSHAQLLEEKNDELIEKDIIRMVDKKKESARVIVKRQKQMKKDAKAKERADAEMEKDDDLEGEGKSCDDAEMDKDKDKEAAEQALLEKDQAKEEAEEKYEKALSAWKNACLPLKLSIEIITNSFAIAGGDDRVDDENDDYDDDMAWDSDQEEKLLKEAQTQNQSFALSKDDELFLNQVVASGLPDRVLAVFGSIFMALVNSGKNNETIHPEVLEDLSEVLSKCSPCLGNIACNLQNSWKCDESDVVAMWNDFRQCLQAAKDTNVNGNIPTSAIAATLSIMAAFLRFRPVLVKRVNEKDLEMILSFVRMEVPENSKSEDEAAAVSDIQKDAIGMLGILCSEPHPSTVNEQICDAFVTLLQRAQTTTAAVMGEVINALMDMYSADEEDANNHEAVFRSKGVLNIFEKTVPILKEIIRADESKGNASYEEVEFLKEIGLNATRFIRYKKGH